MKYLSIISLALVTSLFIGCNNKADSESGHTEEIASSEKTKQFEEGGHSEEEEEPVKKGKARRVKDESESEGFGGEDEEDDENEDSEDEDDAEDVEHSDKGDNVMAEENEKTVQDVIDGMTEEQKNVMYALIGAALE